MDQQWMISFREKLDQHHTWPSVYLFKFIVPKGKESEVKRLFPDHTTSDRISKKGNYISVSIALTMPSSEAVIDVYERAAKIEGIVAL